MGGGACLRLGRPRRRWGDGEFSRVIDRRLAISTSERKVHPQRPALEDDCKLETKNIAFPAPRQSRRMPAGFGFADRGVSLLRPHARGWRPAWTTVRKNR